MPEQIGTPPVVPGLTFLRALGSGGSADVFLYDQNMPRRKVAVKVLKSSQLSSDATASFNAEADVLARLSAHPNILTIFQAGVSADGRPFLATEYCPDSYGQRYKTNPIPLIEVIRVGVKIGGALESAHRIGVLHRDVKPANIFVTEFGAPVLADFGIAAALIGGDDHGFVGMSVPWSAPEVIREDHLGSVPSEVYSLAATLYTLLAGRSPYHLPGGDNSRSAMAARVLSGKLPKIGRADVPGPVEQVLRQGMSSKAEQRPGSVAAFVGQLQQAARAVGIDPGFPEYAGIGDGFGPAIRFDDATERGGTRSSVPHKSTRLPKMPVESGQFIDSATANVKRRPAKARFFNGKLGQFFGSEVGSVRAWTLGGLIIVLIVINLVLLMVINR